jgi:hypothetical protein
MLNFAHILAAIMISAFIGQSAFAAINRAVIAISTPSKIFYKDQGAAISPDLISDFHAIRFSETKIDAAKLIPQDLKPSEDQNDVFSKVADKSLNSWFNSDEMRSTSLGKAATTVEQELQQEIIIQTEDRIQHKFNFNVQAFQAMAQIQYRGFFNSALRYRMAQSKFDLEISRQMFGDKELLLSANSDSSQVAVRWVF